MNTREAFPRSICRAEYGRGKNRLIVSVAQLAPHSYEVITMRPDGTELELVHLASEPDARAVYAQMQQRFGPVAERASETPAMRRLIDALLRAADAARIAANADGGEDGGTCNFDSPALELPRWREADIRYCAKTAGTTVFTWHIGGKRLWVFGVPLGGQANRRSRQAEAMTRSLADAGYDACEYCQMD